MVFIIINMGNQNKKSQFDSSNWEIFIQKGVKTILKNITTHSLLDYYQYEHSQVYTNQYLQNIYQWRQQITIQEHIPQLYHYEVQDSLLGSNQIQKVFTEHLTRFSEIAPISKAQSFLILEQIVQVLPLLFKQFGLFHVNIQTIGINDSGQTKVWMNQNLAKNYAQAQDVIKKPSRNLQLTIVNNLVRMLKTKVYNSQTKPEYPFSLNFLDTLKFIKDTRVAYPQYKVSKVYLDREQFNQQFKAPIKQTSQLSTNELTPRRVKQNEIMQQVKNFVYWQPPCFKNIGLTPQRHQHNIPNNQQFNQSRNNQVLVNKSDTHVNQVISPPIIPNNMPIYRHNNFIGVNPHIPLPNQLVLEQSHYLTNPVPNSPIKYKNIKISPPKSQKPKFSPSKFFKGDKIQVNKVVTYENTVKINRTNGNRSTSTSPIKIQRQIKNVSPIVAPYKPNISLRPIASNNIGNKKYLSRIIQQQEGRFDNGSVKHIQKTVEGGSFNVELVESIYIQSNQTDEGF